jgi:integrase
VARIKYVQQWVDRRQGGAVARYYFRRRGFKRVPLPGLPGSSEFMEAYQAALAELNLSSPIGANKTKAGSVSALVVFYFSSPAFLSLARQTQSTYRLILEKFRDEHGDKPVALLTRQHINAMLAQRTSTPAAANHWLRLVKSLMAFAVVEGFRRDNPAVGIARIKTRSNGFHSWTEDEIAIFEARHPVGTKARLALALGLYTAQRRSDVIRMGRQHIAGGMLSLRQQKTRTTLTIPVHPVLAAIMAASQTGNLTFLVTEYGRPFTAAGFGGWFRKRCDEAGLPKECAFHGLRKAACTRLADAGCSAQRHRLDQRACLSTGSGTLYQGRRPTPAGAHGHGHDENSKCQRGRSR